MQKITTYLIITKNYFKNIYIQFKNFEENNYSIKNVIQE